MLSTTSTIFELKYGEKPKVGLHFKGHNDPRDPMYVELTGPKETYEQQIRNLVGRKKDQGKVSLFKKVELFWPHPLFEVTCVLLSEFLCFKTSPRVELFSFENVFNLYESKRGEEFIFKYI